MPEINQDEDAKRDDERASKKQKHQRILAYTAMWAMIGFTGVILTPLVNAEKAGLFTSFSDLFYISMASVVGAFMGFAAYMTRK